MGPTRSSRWSGQSFAAAGAMIVILGWRRYGADEVFSMEWTVIRSRWRDDRPTRGKLGERVALFRVG